MEKESSPKAHPTDLDRTDKHRNVRLHPHCMTMVHAHISQDVRQHNKSMLQGTRSIDLI